MNCAWFRLVVLLLISLSLSACNDSRQKQVDKAHKVKVAAVQAKDVTLTQSYVGQIRSHHHIKIRAPETGYLEKVEITAGQRVKKEDVLFRFVPVLYQAALDAAKADEKAAQTELDYRKKLHEEKVVATSEARFDETKLAKARAKVETATARLNLATIKAPFDGLVDRLPYQEGTLVQKGETLTTLSDNTQLWVYFNVPETRYLEYKSAHQDLHHDDWKIELMLASDKKFDQPGKLGAVAADFNHETGSIRFRADFPNPDRLLRHGQTGTVLVSRVQHDAIVIPQRATFESHAQRYVYVIDEHDVAHERQIVVQHELDDEFVVKSGVGVGDKIVIDGVQQVRDGRKVEY